MIRFPRCGVLGTRFGAGLGPSDRLTSALVVVVVVLSRLFGVNHIGVPREIMNAEPDLLEHLRTLEESLAKPEIRHSPEQLARLLADDFQEFGGSGRVFDKGQIIDALQSQPAVQIWLDEFLVKCLAPDVALVTYRGNCRFPESDKVSNSLRSSIWRNRDGRWEVVFHQGTPSVQAVKA